MTEYSKKFFDVDVVDIAYQIIAMYKENEDLKHELKHTKELLVIHKKSLDSQIDQQKNMLGMIMTAGFDQQRARLLDQKRKHSCKKEKG